jgi:hypothetical protein
MNSQSQKSLSKGTSLLNLRNILKSNWQSSETNIRDSKAEFMPFLKERDSLGNLLVLGEIKF